MLGRQLFVVFGVIFRRCTSKDILCWLHWLRSLQEIHCPSLGHLCSYAVFLTIPLKYVYLIVSDDLVETDEVEMMENDNEWIVVFFVDEKDSRFIKQQRNQK